MENTGSVKETQLLKRENESLDDFEHLGHDSSPLQEFRQETGDLFGLKTPSEDTHVRDGNPKIDSDFRKISDDLSRLKQAGDSLLDQPLPAQTMDSNLLEINNSFPDRKAADEKLDKFLQEMSAPFAPSDSQRQQKIDSNSIHSFLDNERGELKDFIQEKDEKGSTELLERYSDSEPESEGFKVSKQDDFKKSDEAFDPFASSESIKFKDTFKDLPESQPDIPSKTITSTTLPDFVEEAAKEITKDSTEKNKESKKHVEQFQFEAKQEQKPTPEPTKTQACIKKPTSRKITEAEALFCKMGLDTWFNPERLNPKGFYRIAEFSNIVGCIDGTHIRIKKPQVNTGRKNK